MCVRIHITNDKWKGMEVHDLIVDHITKITKGDADYEYGPMWRVDVVMLRPWDIEGFVERCKRSAPHTEIYMLPGFAPSTNATEEMREEHGNTVTTLQSYPRVHNPDQAYLLQEVDVAYEHALRSLGWLYKTKTLVLIPMRTDDDEQHRDGTSTTKGAAAQCSQSS